MSGYAVEVTLGAALVIVILVAAAVYLARHDRTTRIRLGVFFEREREPKEAPVDEVRRRLGEE